MKKNGIYNNTHEEAPFKLIVPASHFSHFKAYA